MEPVCSPVRFFSCDVAEKSSAVARVASGDARGLARNSDLSPLSLGREGGMAGLMDG